MASLPRLVFSGLARISAWLVLLPAVAAAQAAPGLPLDSLRQEAGDALTRLGGLRPLPAGIYTAFDPDPVHPYVVPACDDDGDAVVVVSDAALKLLEHAGYALARDDLHGTRTREDYGTLLATSQKAASRLLPPGAAFFRGIDATVEAEATRHFRAGLSFWVGRSASVHDAQEFRCSRTDTLRERGDDTWTVAERTVALARAAQLDGGRDLPRTIWSLAGLLALGGDERSAETVARLAGRHPWRGPFPLPSGDVVRITAAMLREGAPSSVSAATPGSAASAPRPPLPRSLARYGRKLP